MNHAIIDKDTGEIIRTLDEPYELRMKKQQEYLDTHVTLNKGREFTKLFEDIALVVKGLSGAAVVITCILATHIRFESNLVAHDNGVPITSRDIELMTGYSEKTVKRSMADLVSHKIFARCYSGRTYKYFANPYVFCKGEKFNKTLVDMFNGYLWGQK